MYVSQMTMAFMAALLTGEATAALDHPALRSNMDDFTPVLQDALKSKGADVKELEGKISQGCKDLAEREELIGTLGSTVKVMKVWAPDCKHTL